MSTVEYRTFFNRHRRRVYTEEKAKVVAAVWGTELLQLLATLAVLHQNENDMKKRMSCTRMMWRTGWIHPFRREWVYTTMEFWFTVHISGKLWTIKSSLTHNRHIPVREAFVQRFLWNWSPNCGLLWSTEVTRTKKSFLVHK